MTEKHQHFANRLRELRDAAGLSQYALAKLTGLKKQTLSKLETGRHDPSWTTIQLLALALDVDCEEFLEPTVALPEQIPARPRGRPPKAAGATQNSGSASKPTSGPSAQKTIARNKQSKKKST
jgi:transcriptional regulator with XRE-family HTH domain